MIKLKELLNERMSKREAGEMLKQLGGNRFIAMTGAKNFVVGPKGAGFKIGKNAWVNDYTMVEKIKEYINVEGIKDHIFLMCAGPFGNILTHQLYESSKENTYIDIGSTLNHFLLGEKGKNRGYLRKESSINQVCTWESNE